MKEGLALDKSFRKTFGRKKVIQTNQSFQRISTRLASEFSKNLNKAGIRGVSLIR